jgi:hypothetical protein
MNDEERSENGDQWDACPAGEIQQMVRRERSRRTTTKLTRAVSATGVVAVLAVAVFVVGWHWLDRQPATPERLSAITCAEVIDHLPAYVNDTLYREDPHVYEAVFQHLQRCRECEAEKRKLVASQSAISAKKPSVARLKRDLPPRYAQLSLR